MVLNCRQHLDLFVENYQAFKGPRGFTVQVRFPGEPASERQLRGNSSIRILTEEEQEGMRQACKVMATKCGSNPFLKC